MNKIGKVVVPLIGLLFVFVALSKVSRLFLSGRWFIGIVSVGVFLIFVKWLFAGYKVKLNAEKEKKKAKRNQQTDTQNKNNN